MSLAKKFKWEPNIWMGVTIESIKHVNRADHLLKTPAKVKFLSLEPLLTPLPNLHLNGIDWVIVGGESGPGARIMEESWILDIQRQSKALNIPFFFKQWGGTNKKRAGRLLNGRKWNEFPIVGTNKIKKM
jgi:protein gp37